MLHLTLEVAHCYLEHFFSKFLVILLDELFAGERTFHGEDLDELLLAALVVVCLDNVDHTVPDGVRDIHTDTFTHQGVTTLRIDNGTLLVHHVIVLQQALTDTEVVLLNLLLSTLNLL